MEHTKRTRGKNRSFPASILGGILGALGVGLCLIFAFSLVAYRTQDPTSLLTPLGLIALGASALACGFCATKLWGHASLFPALIAGVILGVFLVAIGLCFPGSTLPLAIRIGGCPVVVVLSLLGGLLGGKRKRRRHPR